ncbi:MAG: ComEC/Rec2 family competence protein, partial [Mogibacterium sp.]|nr:ComEC/Rec2 family competence protein [Mogibacterium sp.]
MMRRKLVVYTIMLIAGICAGFFIFEKAKLISGLMFMIGTGIAIFVVQPDTNQTGLKAERIICFYIMSLGLLLFAADYSRYESACPGAENVRIYGRVLNAEDKSEYLRLTMADTENHRKVNVNVSKDPDEAADLSYYIGSCAEVTGTVKKLPEADNPGCFDYRRYMRSKGIAYSIKADSVQMDESSPSGIHRVRKYLIKEREAFLSHFEDENRGVLRGVIFGDKSEIDENVLKEFNMNSSGHILAVSGLHIGFLYSLLRLLSGRKKTLPISLIVIFLMTVYGEMTMWSSSTVRAVIVLSLSILSVNLRRPFDLLSSISAAACMILLFRPYMLFNTGFQLSFAAMCSIAFLSKYISAFLGELLGTAVSVQIGTIPLIAMSFHKVNSLALLINIPIIILSSIFVPVSIFFLFIGMVTAHLPGICISCINILCECLVSLNHILSFDGGFSNLVSGAGAAISISFYILIFAASSEWLRVNIIRRNYALLKKTFSIMLIPLMIMHICLYDALKGDEIVFVSVGQGDCTHIRCGKDDILIDGGGSDFVNTGERILMPYLLSQ